MNNNPSNVDLKTFNELQELLDQTQCISGIGSWKLDLVNNQIQLSKQLYRIFGWSERKAYALEDFYGSVHCDDLLRVKGTVRKVISEGGVYKHRYRFVRPDGQVRMLKSEGEGNTAVDGMVTEVVGVTQDITHQEEREKEVKMLSLIARETSDAVIVLSSEGIIQWVNKAFTEITEFTEKEIIHKRFEDFLHGPETDPETLAYKNFMVAQGRPFHCELIKYRKSGEPFWMDIQGYPLYDPKGGMIQFVQIESDITKRKQELIRLKEGHSISKYFARQMINTVEEERARISREVHDQLGQELTGIKMISSVLSHHLTSDKGAELLSELMEMVDESLIVTKNIATRLRPAILDKLGLIPAIEWLVEDQERKSGVSIYLAIQSSPGVYDNSVSIACFRICQEALTNAVKHAKASELTVSLEERAEFLLLSIDDNGVGMDMDNQGKPFSLGILGMKERAELINGVLDINSKPGSGTKIQLKVPVK